MKRLIQVVAAAVLCLCVAAGSALPAQAAEPVRSVVCAGSSANFAVAANGDLLQCGLYYNSRGHLQVLSAYTKVMEDVVSVSAGEEFVLALKRDGSLWAWGENRSGQLASTPSRDYTAKPVKIMDGVRQVSAGDTQAAAITDDGGLWVWGGHHRLFDEGPEPQPASYYRPQKLMDNAVDVAMGDVNILAVTGGGTLLTWEYQWNFEPAPLAERYASVAVMEDVSRVDCGFSAYFAIKTDGTLWGWGYGPNGIFGDGVNEYHHQPVKIMDGVAQVSASLTHTAAMTTGGALYTWGDNEFGQLGTGDTKDRHRPVKVMDGVSAVNAGYWMTSVVRDDGTLWCCGWNILCVLGDGTDTDRHTPVMVLEGVALPGGGRQAVWRPREA